MLDKEEFEHFKKVFDEILLPLIDEHKEDIIKIMNEHPEFKSRVENKVVEILERRKSS